MNRALRVGRVPAIVVDTLAALAGAGVHEHFLVVGTHALYAYETACGVRVAPDATATRDIDLLFDTRKRLSFATQLRRSHRSLLALLRTADKTFSVRRDQLQTIVNADGFEVDIIRRIAKDGDPHPLRMSDDESDVWAVQVGLGDKLLSCRRFDQVVVSTTGAMARMATVHPLDFVATKRALAQRPERDPLKRSKDKLQAAVVEELVNEYLPQLGPPRITISPEKCYFAETSVKSRTIRSIGYDGPSQVLEVEYPSGDVYRYSGVPAAEVEALLAANSIGAYVNSHIKVYPFEKKFAPSFHEGEDPGFS